MMRVDKKQAKRLLSLGEKVRQLETREEKQEFILGFMKEYNIIFEEPEYNIIFEEPVIGRFWNFPLDDIDWDNLIFHISLKCMSLSKRTRHPVTRKKIFTTIWEINLEK